MVIKGLGIGGAERLISEGARLWDRDRFAYHVAYALPWKDQLVPELEAQGVPVRCFGGRRGLTPSALPRLRRLIGSLGAGLVHAHLPTVGVAARLVSPVPVVYTEHNLPGSYAWATRVANRSTYHRNAAVIAVSEAVAAGLAGYRGPDPLVIPNGVAPAVSPARAEAARAELGIAPGTPLVVHVGNLRPGKGHLTLVEAVSALPEDVLVVSIGAERRPGDLDRLRRRVAEAGAGGRLRLLGRREDALAFLAAADVVVNPADVEGLPLGVLEALALGRPVVATRVGGVPEVVIDGRTGLLVEPGRPDALAGAIRSLLDRPRLAARLGAAGRRLVEEEHGLEPMVRAVEEVYLRVLEARAHRSTGAGRG